MRAKFIFYFVLVSCFSAMSEAITLSSAVNAQAVLTPAPGPPLRHSVSDEWDVCYLMRIQ